MTNEKPMDPRETFANNEEAIAQKRQEIAEAAVAGDYEKIGLLVQEAQKLETEKAESDNNTQSEALEENTALDAEKAAAEKAQRDAELAEQSRLQAEKDQQQAAELLAKLQGSTTPSLIEKPEAMTTASAEPANNESVQESVEDIYGMSLPELEALIQSRGYTSELSVNDPNFKQKYAEFINHQKVFGQAEVKLFDRVLSGEASEEEMKIAVDHAADRAQYGVRGFNSFVPKAWYSNERIAEAVANVSPDNRKWVNYVKENYSNERLRKQYRIINEKGDVATYERK